MPDKTSLTYTRFFCEENIWKLIESLQQHSDITPLDVLFIVNPSHSVALYQQAISENGELIIWDYHVILVARLEQNIVIYDFDSRCDFPTPINDYFHMTFQNWELIDKKLKPLLRPINAIHYFNHFTSDRSHMKGVISDSLFPVYPIINNTHSTQSLGLSKCRDCSHINEQLPLVTPADYLQCVQAQYLL